MGLGLRILLPLLLVAAALTAPSAAASETKTCSVVPHGGVTGAGTCARVVHATTSMRITLRANVGANGVAHVDAVNAQPGGEHYAFECALFPTVTFCTREIELRGAFEGAWTVSGTAANANTFGREAGVDMIVTTE